ncbi:DUF6258 family protein [Ensifer adhaerens]
MKPDDFLNSIYLGDLACKAILLDGWRKEVKIQIDAISRVRGETWDFYSAEDVVDGFLVFEGVDHISFDPPGNMPNDDFGDIEFLGSRRRSLYCDARYGFLRRSRNVWFGENHYPGEGGRDREAR